MTAPAATQPAGPATFADAQDIFEGSLPGYTRRPHQMGLAAEIEKIITLARDGEHKHGLFQAGTGVGKSFAILVPLFIAAAADRKRSVVATSTKMLQTQYAKGDIPFLNKHLGLNIITAVLKGRSNYPCWAKAEEIGTPTAVQRLVIGRMEEAAKDGLVDREDFPEVQEEEFRAFSMSAAECPGAKTCPFAHKCFAERAKERAAAADIVVTNTAMLLLDLKLRNETDGNVALLGDFDLLAIDEAHELPDATTRTLEDTIGEGTFIKLARDMGGYLERENGDAVIAEKIELATSALWNLVQMRHADFILRAPSRSDPMPLTVHTIINDLGEGFRGLYQSIKATRDEIKATPALDERGKIQRLRLMRRSADWLARILAYTTDEPDKTLRWVEQDTQTIRGQKRTRLYLRSAPISVGPFLRSAMWNVAPTILSSATLAAGTKLVDGRRVPDFDYLAEALGLDKGEALTYDAGSPFDYPRQATLFVPGKGFPEPDKQNMPAWRAAAQAATYELVTRSGGGALLLFTSTTALNEAYGALARQFRAAGLTVLRQGEQPNGELVRIFKADGHAVLFGLKSFMVGVDVPGKALRLVVLDKLPFAVPTDLLYQARCEAIERQYRDRWASFTRLTIPMMVLTLTQAFGRLIRHANDAGVVAILDSRLHTKRYGQTILSALPPARQTSSIAEAGAFLESAR